VGAVAVLLILAWTGTAALAAGSESPAPDATESSLDPIWLDTASEEPTKAQLAFNKLAGLGESAVAFLTGKVSPARPVDAKRIGVLLGQLDAAEFTERARAERELARMDRQAVAMLYRCRWQIEIFFRFFKHALGCRSLLSTDKNGIELETYAAIIACLLIALWTGRKPTLSTYRMLCWYFTGWADEEELLRHIGRLRQQDVREKLS
jgi:hypothetical protein